MRRTERLWAAVAVLVALAGCAGGAAVKPAAKNANQDAAALQVKLGQGYMNQGELEIARDKLRRALDLDPNSVDAHTVMAVLHERINRRPIAEQHYRRAVELKPDDGAANNNYGTFLCAEGKYAEAQVHFARAVADPFYRSPATAFTNAGICAQRAGDSERAEQLLRESLKLQPRQPMVLFELARLSFAKGDMLRARAFLQRYEALVDAEAAALDLGVRVETELGDRKAAARYAEALQQRFPDYAPHASEPNATGSQ